MARSAKHPATVRRCQTPASDSSLLLASLLRPPCSLIHVLSVKEHSYKEQGRRRTGSLTHLKDESSSLMPPAMSPRSQYTAQPSQPWPEEAGRRQREGAKSRAPTRRARRDRASAPGRNSHVRSNLGSQQQHASLPSIAIRHRSAATRHQVVPSILALISRAAQLEWRQDTARPPRLYSCPPRGLLMCDRR